jgi:hypothetical protein
MRTRNTLFFLLITVVVNGQTVANDSKEDAKISALVNQMSLQEKVSLLHGNSKFYVSGHLDREILRKEFGFKGVLMTDWSAAHSTVKAALTGLDLEGIFETRRVTDGRVAVESR